MEGTIDETLVKDPAEDSTDILKSGGGADAVIPNGLNGECEEDNDDVIGSKNLNQDELLNACDNSENKEPVENEEDENMEVEYNDDEQENNIDEQENNTADSANECDDEKSEDKLADSEASNKVKNVDNVKSSENVISEVSDKNGIDKESEKDDFVESMEVDGKSNSSDVECLDENELLASDNEDNLSNSPKTPEENNKISSNDNKDRQLNDSAEIIDSSLDASDVKICEENGSVGSSDVEEVTDGAKSNGQNDDDLLIEEKTPKKKNIKKIDLTNITPRRSSRNIKRTSYSEKEAEERDDGSDIEEIKPVDPLADMDHPKENSKYKPSILKNLSPSNSKTIVVNDTKRLVEIAAGSKSSKGSKKEPTLVIIDTNSILSGRGGIPVSSNSKSITHNSSHYQHSSHHPISTSSSFSMVPIGVNSQTMYHHNMRTTITPVPLTSKTTHLNPKTTISPVISVSQSTQQAGPQILPTLTDDMFVVEAPSFIVPYVYEKPPIKPLTDFVKKLKKSIQEVEKEEKIRKEKEKEKDKTEDENDSDSDSVDKKDDDVSSTIDLTDKDSNQDDAYEEKNKLQTYFDLPLGKFFMQIGMNLVQEYVQTDLLRTQKRKQSKGGSTTVETQMAINSLIKNLEYSKENNEPFHLDMKKCEFCNFKTESSLVMQHHMETPHMRNYMYKCNFCPAEVRSPHEILFHMEEEHNTRGRLERGPAFHQCPNCPFEDNQKGKLSRHILACTKKFRPERNLEPSLDWEPPAKIPRMNRPRAVGPSASASAFAMALPPKNPQPLLPKLLPAPVTGRGRGRPPMQPRYPEMKIMRPGGGSSLRAENLSMMYRPTSSGLLMPTSYQLAGNQIFQNTSVTVKNPAAKLLSQPSISITPLPRTTPQQTPSAGAGSSAKPGGKTTFVICEICDGYIKDLEQLRNHMQWIHKVKIHPKMIYNRPPLNCQKCQFRFFTDQGLERHLLGSHGLVTSSMQEAANKGKDAGRCPACGRVFQWKLLNHVARDHGMTLKPAHLSYKCTVCTATFGMYKQFENHVYSAHSVVAKRVMDKKSTPSPSSRSNDSLLKPLKINDEITIIPQPAKLANRSSGSQGRGK